MTFETDDTKLDLISQPLEFPPAVMLPCTRINTRAYDPHSNRVALIKNVLVIMEDDEEDISSDDGFGGSEMMDRTGPSVYYAHTYADDDIATGANMSTNVMRKAAPLPQARGTIFAEEALSSVPDTTSNKNGDRSSRAYWLQNSLSQCIYGTVRKAVQLRRRTPTGEINAEWELTYPRIECAVKEMQWEKIRRYRQRNEAEDPIKEVSAMQFISRLPETPEKQFVLQQKDLLFDDRYLYSIMPFCNKGELFGVLETSQKFSENEARFFMIQMLLGLKYMQEIAGVCHRDVSLENFLVNEDENGVKCILIDLGMCLRAPHIHCVDGVLRRLRMPPQGTCGKWFYMSPEVLRNDVPIDGYKCDMWALGIILYMMLMGSNPFDAPRETDRYFQFITSGHLKRMFLNGGYSFSEEVMDFMQRLLTKDIQTRLGLQQAISHPWILTGQDLPPPPPQQQQMPAWM